MIVPNLASKLVDMATGLIQQPWSDFLQQFTLPPAPIQTVEVTASPFVYQFVQPGTLVIEGGTISDVSLTRGKQTISMGTARVFALTFKDTVKITYSVKPNVTFLPTYMQGGR